MVSNSAIASNSNEITDGSSERNQKISVLGVKKVKE